MIFLRFVVGLFTDLSVVYYRFIFVSLVFSAVMGTC